MALLILIALSILASFLFSEVQASRRNAPLYDEMRAIEREMSATSSPTELAALCERWSRCFSRIQ